MSFSNTTRLRDEGNNPYNSENPFPVFVHDQTTEIVDLYVHYNISSNLTLDTNTSVDDTSIVLTDSTGVLANQIICLKEEGRYTQLTILNVTSSTNTLELDGLLDFAYTTAAEIHNADINMNVDGSSTVQIFNVKPPIGAKWDITRVLFHIEDGTAMDSATFGGISGLTKGMILRVNNGVKKNVMNIKTNGEFGERAYDTEYDPKAPAGLFGFRCRRSFGGQDKNGVSIRLDGDESDELHVIIQDDLTGLNTFRCIVQGHRV